MGLKLETESKLSKTDSNEKSFVAWDCNIFDNYWTEGHYRGGGGFEAV